MFIDRLLNQGDVPVLEKVLDFTAARHKLIAENVVNLDTPNYRQKDLSVAEFQKQLGKRIEDRQEAAPGSVNFNDIPMDPENPQQGILFHDGNNRSSEQLMTDQAKNAMLHNFAVELLRKQYQQMDMALKERIG